MEKGNQLWTMCSASSSKQCQNSYPALKHMYLYQKKKKIKNLCGTLLCLPHLAVLALSQV